MQAQWFTAGCHAGQSAHLGGVHCWSIGTAELAKGAGVTDQRAGANSLGAPAVASCVTALERAGR